MSDFTVKIDSTLDLNKAKSDLESFINKKYEIKLLIDDSALSKVNLSSKDLKVKTSVDTSGIKQASQEFQKLKSLAAQISKTKIQISKLDTTKNSNELSTLQKQLKQLQNEYNSIFSNANLDTDQLESLNRIFSNANLKIEQTESKMKDLANSTAKTAKSFSTFDAVSASNKTLTWLNNNTKAAKEYGDALREIANRQKNATSNEELAQANKEFKSLTSEIKAAGKTGNSVFSEFTRAFGQIGEFVGVHAVLQEGVDAARQMVTEVINVDDAMTSLRMATGANVQEATKLMETYSKMGEDLKATGVDVAASATEWLKQGKSIEESEQLAANSIVLSKIGDMSSTEATKTITAAMKSYDLATDEVENFVDQISAIDMASATDVAGLSSAFNEVAANAKNAGIESEKLLAYAAAIGETTQEGMSSVGTALNAMFSRMGNIKLSRLVDYQTSEDLSNVETVLRGVGISLRDSQESFRDFDDVLDETAGRWSSFSETQQRAIAQAFAGTNHMNSFIVLMQQYAQAQEYMQIANEASGQSMEKFAAYQDSLTGRIEGLKNQFQSLSTTVINGDIFKGLVSSGTGVLSFLDTVIDKFGLIPTLAAGLSFKNVGRTKGCPFLNMPTIIRVPYSKNAVFVLSFAKYAIESRAELTAVCKCA